METNDLRKAHVEHGSTSLRLAAEMALVALEDVVKWYASRDANENLMPCHNQNPEIKLSIESVEALRQALNVDAVNMSQERVDETAQGKYVLDCPRCGHCCPERKWVGLTDADIAKTMHGSVEGSNMLPYQFARAIEQALKEKNG